MEPALEELNAAAEQAARDAALVHAVGGDGGDCCSLHACPPSQSQPPHKLCMAEACFMHSVALTAAFAGTS